MVQYEFSHPDDLEATLRDAPVAYVPLGTYEHHGWHLPVGFDGIKAHALCLRAAEQTGGGHVSYKWTAILDEPLIRPLLAATLDRLARFGFRVVVLLTGHYPPEQVRMVHSLAEEAAGRHLGTRFIGLTEAEIMTALPGDDYPGDHAAKYETSVALALAPEWVRLERLTPGRDPALVTLPDTLRRDGRPYDPIDPLYAIWGDDPRVTATMEIGQTLVKEITGRLVERVSHELREVTRG